MRIRSALDALVAIALLTVAACDSGPPENVVAEAGERTLTVEEVTSIMAERSNIPNSPDVVRAVAELWLDYMLLALEYQEDPSFEGVDISSVVENQMDQELILAYRDREVQVDTSYTEEELRAEYDRLGTDVQLRARHILLSFPDGATEAQRDSVVSLAEELARRAREGEDFAALAEEYSDDPGSAAQGGDLGTFGRGAMVPAFEEAAFALEEGEIGQPVESPYGVHVIQLQERIAPAFDEVRDEFTRQLTQRRVYEAESVFVAEIEEIADPRMDEEALGVVRQLAGNPGTSLSDGARERPLVSLRDGAFTVGDFQEFIRTRPPQERAQIQQGTDDQLEGMLLNLARREALVGAAGEAGVELAESRADSLERQVREQLRQAAASLQLGQVEPGEDESREDALERAVQDVLTRTLQGQRGVVPLGPLSFALREEGGRLYEAGIQRAARAIQEVEGGTPGTPGGAAAPGGAGQGAVPPPPGPGPAGAGAPGGGPAAGGNR